MEEEEEQGDLMTFEPTQDELEKERLTARAEQVSRGTRLPLHCPPSASRIRLALHNTGL